MSPNPSAFEILNDSIPVKVLLGAQPLRIYPWGEAPHRDELVKPYATYLVYNAIPENFLGETPDIDNHGTQFDVYAEDGQSCESCFRAIRDALEPYAHMTNFSLPFRDPATQLYTARLEFDFWEPR